MAAAPSRASGPVLAGLMQERPLLIADMIRHAAAINGGHEIVSRDREDSLVRTNYRALEGRSRALAAGLARLGIREGDRVASLAWNTRRHVELFCGVPGLGAVLHTVNPRYGEDRIVYILNHAADRVLAFDPDLLPLVERIAPRLETIEHFVLLGDEAELPAGSARPLLAYEALLGDGDFDWPLLDERAAAMLCYTSGTTGDPKGVLTSHRSTVIHALAAQSAVAFGLTPLDTVLLVVPMFHAFGWGLPYVAAISGAKLVLPGPAADSASLVALIGSERATLAMGVPTVWNGILDHLEGTGGTLAPLERALIGGSAVPPAIARRLAEDHGVRVVTGWGMTELSPLASFTGATPGKVAAVGDAGRILFPLEVRVRDSKGEAAPADGATSGDISVRGPCAAAAYFGQAETALDSEGWLPTGDVGTIDPHGAIAITDRFKDLIKSGGEWISSAELERIAASVAGVALAAAIAVDHPKWQERPLLLVVPERGGVDLGAVAAALAAALPRWQCPDDILTVDALPLTATGKIDKKVLRARYRDHLVTGAEPALAAEGVR